MLRALVILLVLANLGSYAWQTGWLAPLGLQPRSAQEPQRVEQQLRPEAIRLLNGQRPATSAAPTAVAPANPAAPSSPPPPANEAPAVAADAGGTAPSSSTAATACFEASGFDAAQADQLRAELGRMALPDNAWRLSEVSSAGRWIVYMGRYDNAEQAARKKAELRGMGLDTRDVNTPGLAPGIALGTFSSAAAAQEALQQAERRGVRTARVVQERAESLSYTLRLPAITDALRQRIDGLGPATAGRPLQRCG